MNLSSTPRRARGFTLVEAIIVMVITGILAGMVAIFIKAPVQSYVDSVARAELSDAADVALRRISRDLRLALPNSVLVSADGRTIQFLQTKTGGRYMDVRDDPPATVQPLSFTNTSALTFDMAGSAPVGRQAIAVGDFIVIYNLGLGQAPADAYSLQNVAKVTAVNGTRLSFASVTPANGTVALNPFANATLSMPSPDFRFQVVTGSVGYQCVIPASGVGTMIRYASNTVPSLSIQPAIPPGNAAMMSSVVGNCQFNYAQLANSQAAMVTIELTLRHTNGETVRLVRQVHVDNTP